MGTFLNINGKSIPSTDKSLKKEVMAYEKQVRTSNQSYIKDLLSKLGGKNIEPNKSFLNKILGK